MKANQATNVARKIRCPRPGYPEPETMNRRKTANSASMISDRVIAKRWNGSHLSSCLKRPDTKIVATVALKNAIRPLVMLRTKRDDLLTNAVNIAIGTK